jgi:PAS domain-containing protein
MSGEARAPLSLRNLRETVRALQDELANTNRDMRALAVELETRLEQLRAAEERYRRLAENAPDIISLCWSRCCEESASRAVR